MIYLLQKAQIFALNYNESSPKKRSEYVDYIIIFLFDLAMGLPKNTGINKHAIKLQDDK